MAKKLRKFKLAGTLPKIARAQAQVTNALLCHLPQTTFESGFKERMKAALEPLVHADIDVWFEGVRLLGEGELKMVLAEPTCAAIVGLPPRTEKALLEIDLAVAQLTIDKLLGGNAEETDNQRPLSEIEDGVFSFVLLRLLAVLQADAAAEKEIALKLEGVHGTMASLQERFDVEQRLVCLSFKLFFDVKVGFARIYLPESFVAEAFPTMPAVGSPQQQRWLRRINERIDVVRLLTAPLVVEVGRIGLQITDVEALEVDDIILVEDSEVKIVPGEEEDQPGALTGRVQCRVGDGHRGIIAGALVVGEESGRYEVQIEAISPAGEPRAMAHLFRDGGGEVQGGMDDGDGGGGGGEDARRLSAGGLVDARAHAARLRAAAAARLGGAGAPLPAGAGGADDEGAGEHSEGEDGGDDDVNAEAAGLLDDISVAMVVELGRVMVSASDVVQLRAGQVIELARAPGEPVDLVVDGKRVGKGELVEIDGELGVRILSLVK